MKIEIKLPDGSSFIERLKESQDAVAKERDKLRDLVTEYESLAECCDEAIDDLEMAIDKLSEYV